MRIVLDTNILVSALLSPHGPGRVLDLLLAGQLVLLTDDRILGEYDEVLARPKFGFSADDVAEVLNYCRTTSERVLAPPLDVSLPDHGDLPFLEVAMTGEADALVTGNTRHFVPVGGTHSVAIVSPAELLQQLYVL